MELQKIALKQHWTRSDETDPAQNVKRDKTRTAFAWRGSSLLQTISSVVLDKDPMKKCRVRSICAVNLAQIVRYCCCDLGVAQAER